MKKILVCISIMFITAMGQVPSTISFQGYITNVDEQPLPAGNYYLEFSIFDAETEGTSYWSESHFVEVTEETGFVSLLFLYSYYI